MLNLVTTNTGRGRRAVSLNPVEVRDITDEDIQSISTPDSTPAVDIKKMHDRHHSLARLLSAGTSEGEAAVILGYTASRVSVIKASPLFQELLEFYRREVDSQFSSTLEHMAGLSRDALLELRDRMETHPENFTVNELRSIAVDLGDRVQKDESAIQAKLPTMIELVAPESGDTQEGKAEGEAE